jgi:hypothetical protein
MKEWTGICPIAGPPMFLRLVSLLAAGSTAYITLATIFWLVCIGIGHNRMEMLYGTTALYLLTLAAAVEGAWLLPEDIRRSSSFMRLTHWLRSRWD